MVCHCHCTSVKKCAWACGENFFFSWIFEKQHPKQRQKTEAQSAWKQTSMLGIVLEKAIKSIQITFGISLAWVICREPILWPLGLLVLICHLCCCLSNLVPFFHRKRAQPSAVRVPWIGKDPHQLLSLEVSMFHSFLFASAISWPSLCGNFMTCTKLSPKYSTPCHRLQSPNTFLLQAD